VRAVRLALVIGVALAAFGIGGCGPPHHQAADTSGVALTGGQGRDQRSPHRGRWNFLPHSAAHTRADRRLHARR
jgi:hypothetical protein